MHEELERIDRSCRNRLDINNRVDHEKGSENATPLMGVYRNFKHYFADNDDHIKKQLVKLNSFMNASEPQLMDLKGVDDKVINHSIQFN